MTFAPLRDWGKYGIVHDTPAEALPVGVWSNGRNVRFTGIHMEKMQEGILESSFYDNEEPPNYLLDNQVLWMQGWSDGLSSYVVVFTQAKAWFLSRGDAEDPGTWLEATRESGDYSGR